MDSRDSLGPTGQIESIKSGKETLDGKKRRNPFEKSEIWVPCENDEIVTHEKLVRLLQDDDRHHYQAHLRNFVRSRCCDKETADDICQQTWAIMLAKVRAEKIYQSGLERYMATVA